MKIILLTVHFVYKAKEIMTHTCFILCANFQTQFLSLLPTLNILCNGRETMSGVNSYAWNKWKWWIFTLQKGITCWWFIDICIHFFIAFIFYVTCEIIWNIWYISVAFIMWCLKLLHVCVIHTLIHIISIKRFLWRNIIFLCRRNSGCNAMNDKLWRVSIGTIHVGSFWHFMDTSYLVLSSSSFSFSSSS